MKNVIFFLGVLFCSSKMNAQVANCEQVQKDVLSEINLVESFNQKYQETFVDMTDSLRIHNELLKQNMVYFIESGAYKTCPINTTPVLKFVQSPDQKMMAVSWNTHMGGTMIDFASIIGYTLADGTIRTKRMEIGGEWGVNQKILIDKIYTIKNSKKVSIYLVASQGQGSTLTPFYTMTAYKVESELVKTPIFAGQKSLMVDFDYTSDNTSYLPKDFNGFQFLKKGMFIRKPISEKNGIFKGRYEIYKFDGSQYYRMK